MGSIRQGGNQARILNLIWMADRVCQDPTLVNLQGLRDALDALPEGWEELVEEEIVEQDDD